MRRPIGKRELLASGLRWSGALSVLSKLPAKNGLLVLCYHRIAEFENEAYDPSLISATGDQFNDQVSFLKRKGLLVTLDEALAFVEGRSDGGAPRLRVLITFDDGYLDNYETAFPILRSHGAQGVFFLCTSLVGSNAVLWWDEIAYLLKNAQRPKFTLRYPAELKIDIAENGVDASVRSVNHLYRKPENVDPERFMRELKEALGESSPHSHPRRYLNWDEAREMIGGGMAIGGHTHSHRMLSKLEPEEQRRELVQSRATIGEQLGIEVNTLAYPYGPVYAFTNQTGQIAKEAGYRAAFSYHGGFNQAGSVDHFDVKRVAVDGQDFSRFRAQVGVSQFTGKFWP